LANKEKAAKHIPSYGSIVVSTSCVLEDEVWKSLVCVGMFNSSGSCLNTLRMVLWTYPSFVAADKHAIGLSMPFLSWKMLE